LCSGASRVAPCGRPAAQRRRPRAGSPPSASMPRRRCEWSDARVSWLAELLAEAQESRGVRVEDVVLLLRGEEVGRIDAFDREADGAGPRHLIRTEHDALPQPAVERLLQEGMEGGASGPAANPVDRGDVDVELRV